MLDRAALRASLLANVEAFTRIRHKAEHREHLGASLAGRECSRYLWNTFRWLLLEEHEGRMRRLFNRGQREEHEFIDLLRGAGWQVFNINPQTGKQYRIAHMSGHIGGSLDGILVPPGSNMGFIGEFKTHNDKSFTTLVKDGVLVSKREHFIQMSIYGWYYQLTHGLYCAVNKNTDAIHWEIVELDWGAAQHAITRLEAIVGMQHPPGKISPTPTHFVCKRCHFSGICHSGEAPEKNCRSCEHAAPTTEGHWHCNAYRQDIPHDVIPVGCNAWKRLV